ncbi:MAG TPA: hypothetical protein VF588_15155 [Pyrinomonadaceae bacterium]|jgi:hypothetical protein
MTTINEGKTFADVFDNILSDWKKFIAFLAATAGFCGLLLLLFLLITKVLGVTTARELKLSTSGAQILFESQTSHKSEYLILVHPQGWQDAGIRVRGGDSVEFKADGRVTVDLNGIAERTLKRHQFEQKYVKLGVADPASESPDKAPEVHFNAEERKALELRRGWVGPEGYTTQTTDQSFASRRTRRLLPDVNLGALVAAVKDDKVSQPGKAQAFYVGGGKTLRATGDGELWFNVNDVMNEGDQNNSDLFYADNIGFFWVKVTVEPAPR